MSNKKTKRNSWRYQSTEIPVEIDDNLNILDTTYFNDGKHCIDYILLWIKSTVANTTEVDKVRHAYRKRFEECLKKKGLMLETSIKEHDTDAYNFVKVGIFVMFIQFFFLLTYKTYTPPTDPPTKGTPVKIC